MRPIKKFMLAAIEQAKLARRRGDYAIGAVVVRGNKIIARRDNQSKNKSNPLLHAEVTAITTASRRLKSRHLKNCVLYTTHEPCPMCSSLAVWAKLKGIVYGALEKDMRDYGMKNSNHHYLWRTIKISCKEVIDKSPEKIKVVGGFMRKECVKIFHNSK